MKLNESIKKGGKAVFKHTTAIRKWDQNNKIKTFNNVEKKEYIKM